MNELQKQMQKRWDEKGWDYDQAHSHGIDNPDEIKIWSKRLSESLKEKLQVLDVGTGTGFLSILAAELGHDVTAIDWSKTMLQQAKTKAQNKHLNIQFVEGMTEKMPFEDDQFDVVTARHVVWTLSDPEQAIAEWYRVIKPGGKVYADYSPRTSEHHVNHYNEEVEKSLPFNSNCSLEDVTLPFKKVGFTDVQVSRLEKSGDHHHHSVTYMISALK